MGVFLSGSSAGYALLLFALVLTLWIINKGSKMGYTVLIFGVALLLIILIDAFFLSGQLQEVLKKISIETQTSFIFIIIALIPLIHAIVDYNFRNISISVLFVYFIVRIDTLCHDLKNN